MLAVRRSWGRFFVGQAYVDDAYQTCLSPEPIIYEPKAYK